MSSYDWAFRLWISYFLKTSGMKNSPPKALSISKFLLETGWLNMSNENSVTPATLKFLLTPSSITPIWGWSLEFCWSHFFQLPSFFKVVLFFGSRFVSVWLYSFLSFLFCVMLNFTSRSLFKFLDDSPLHGEALFLTISFVELNTRFLSSAVYTKLALFFTDLARIGCGSNLR